MYEDDSFIAASEVDSDVDGYGQSDRAEEVDEVDEDDEYSDEFDAEESKQSPTQVYSDDYEASKPSSAPDYSDDYEEEEEATVENVRRPSDHPSPHPPASINPTNVPQPPTVHTDMDIRPPASLSVLLRQMESRYVDEVEELREQNAHLSWRERELKAELRRRRDDSKLRKAHLYKKRQRAEERRKEHAQTMTRLQRDLAAVDASRTALTKECRQLQDTIHTLHESLSRVHDEKRVVEERNLELAEKLQTTLNDFHALNLKYEGAISGKMDAEKRIAELQSSHAIELEVAAHKHRIDMEHIQNEMNKAAQALEEERKTLPETYRLHLENEKQRYEGLETALHRQMRDVESACAKEIEKHQKEVAHATALQRESEEKAAARVEQELSKISREREAVDEQRRDLVVFMAKANARVDDERGKLEALRRQVDAKHHKVIETQAQLDVRASSLDERQQRLEEDERVVEKRRSEVTSLSRETLVQTSALAKKVEAASSVQQELEALRSAHEAMKAKVAASEQHETELAAYKRTLAKAAEQLQQERLVLARQRAVTAYQQKIKEGMQVGIS